MTIAKELTRALSIQSAKQELSKYPTLEEYINGTVFRNQVVCYTEEMNWSVNRFVAMVIEVNGLNK